MFRMLGWLVIIIIAVAYFFPSDEKKENATVEVNQDEMRLESATTEQKACVKTLGQGVYKISLCLGSLIVVTSPNNNSMTKL